MNDTELREFYAEQRAQATGFLEAELDKWCVELGWPERRWEHLRDRDQALERVSVALVATSKKIAEAIAPTLKKMAQVLTTVHRRLRDQGLLE